MQKSDEERALEKLFEALRNRDRAQTPPFAKLWRGAQAAATRERRLHPRPRLVLAVASAVLFSLGVVIMFRQFHGAGDGREIPTISDWQSPTATLLMYPRMPAPKPALTPEPPTTTASLSRWNSPTRNLAKRPLSGSMKKLL